MDGWTLGNIIRTVFEFAGPGAGLAVVGGSVVFLYLRERRKDMESDRLARQQELGAVLAEVSRHRDLLERNLTESAQRNGLAFDKLAENITQSTGVLQALEDQMTVSLERHQAFALETDRRLRSAEDHLQHIRDNLPKGGNA